MTNLPEPTETGLGWHNGLARILIGSAIAGMGYLFAVVLLEDLKNKQYCFVVVNFAAILLLFGSTLLGAKGIQAMGRVTGAKNNDREFWLTKTRKCFSYQLLTSALGLFVGVGIVVVRSV